MKRKQNYWGMGLCIAGLLAASTSQASLTVLTFDENGNYSSSVPAGGVAAPTGVLDVQGADSLPATGTPSGGGATTLDYLLPYPTAGLPNNAYQDMGWLVVLAPGQTTVGVNDANIVDLIHFDNSYQGGTPPGGVSGTVYDQIFYYSMEGSGNLANNWVSASTLSAILAASQTVEITEPNNGQILYTPTSGEAGYIHGQSSQPYTYDFESVVPEPATVITGLLLLLPLGASAFRIIRSRKTLVV